MSINISIDDSAELATFRRDLARMDREVSKELNRSLRDVLNQRLVPAARSNASWSSRIPSRIKPMVQAKRVGLRVSSKGAPHARPFEGLQAGLRSRGGSFRHPVFGNRSVWVSQAHRPFLAPAVMDNADNVVSAVNDAIGDAARKVGFQ